MKNYYITESGDKVEIIDKELINLFRKGITELFITDLPKCEKLYLNGNSLKSVDLNLPKCITLSLDDNNLESVDFNLPLCSYLCLDHNRLKLVDLNLPKCVRLDLDYNNIESVKLYLPECETLYLDHNNLKSVEIDLPKCVTLYLDHNNLESVNLDLPKITYLKSDLIKLVQSNGDIVMGFDSTPTIVDSERKMGEFIIYKGRYKNSNIDVYAASRSRYTAHGDTVKEAIEDCNFKFLQETVNVGPYFAECKDKGVMSVSDYRLLTGACESGCNNFLESKDITSTEMKFDDAMELLEENEPYGWNKIKELI